MRKKHTVNVKRFRASEFPSVYYIVVEPIPFDYYCS